MLPFPVPCLPRRVAVGPHTIYLVEPAMRDAFALLERVAAGALPVLIHGETGVGKELAAQAVHQFSTRGDGPLVPINCGAIPEGLAESELFGHERGAFSGAWASRRGLFETARGGTVFLDEIGELPLASQARLLRVLDRGAILPVGASTERVIDTRVVAATHRDLAAEVAAGRFREDLFFRLSGACVAIPPLRARAQELPYLIADLLRAPVAPRSRPAVLDAAAMDALVAYRWPGNVRELKHALAYAVAAAGPHARAIELEHLPLTIGAGCVLSNVDDAMLAPRGPTEFKPLADELRAIEALRMRQALACTGGVQSRAAALLHMPRRTFLTRLKQYGLDSGPSVRRSVRRSR